MKNTWLWLLVGVVGFLGPLTAFSQNAGVSGTIDASVVRPSTPDVPYESFGIHYTTTGGASLQLNGFTVHNNTGVQFTFPEYTLASEETVTVCERTPESEVSVECDLLIDGAIWDPAGDEFLLYDEHESLLGSFAVSPLEEAAESFGTFEFAYEAAVPETLEVVDPPEDGLTLSGVSLFEVVVGGVDGELVIDWSLRQDNCATGTLITSRATASADSQESTETGLIVSIDTDALGNGTYCFRSTLVRDGDLPLLDDERLFDVHRYIDPEYVLSGFSYNDSNGNGRYESTVDSPLAGRMITVRAEESGTVYSTTTKSDGSYRFLVSPGQWTVHEVVPSLWVQTGLMADGELVYSVPAALATTSAQRCVLDLLVTDEDGDVMVGTCDFLSYETKAIGQPGNSGGTKVGERNRPVPRVLGAASTTAQCGRYLTTYLGPTLPNQAFEVQKLQLFLTARGWYTPLTGRYDNLTSMHVKALQAKEAEAILRPWVEAGFMASLVPTGNVYKTTRAFINNTLCPGSDSPTLP